MKHIISVFVILTFITACQKTEGEGGTSTITGLVKSQSYDAAEAEITEIIFSPGVDVEHGDYWVLNNSDGFDQYYIYYDNPGWASEANPGLEGRIGIAVEFNYSDSNTEIAANTLEELENETSDFFTYDLNVDILRVTNKIKGIVADFDKVSSPFEFNTDNQGKAGFISPLFPAVDEKVYIVYGDATVYSDQERTGGDGEYQFTNLTPGLYTIYSVSKDTLSGGTMKISKSVEITDKKSIVAVEEISIYD